MTVKELIKKLKTCAPDSQVIVSTEWGYCNVTEIEESLLYTETSSTLEKEKSVEIIWG